MKNIKNYIINPKNNGNEQKPKEKPKPRPNTNIYYLLSNILSTYVYVLDKVIITLDTETLEYIRETCKDIRRCYQHIIYKQYGDILNIYLLTSDYKRKHIATIKLKT